MPIATNANGEALFLSQEGEWKPAQIAENPQTKQKLAFDGKDWVPFDGKPVDRLPGQPTMPEVDAAMRTGANALTFGMADRLAAGGQALTGGAPSYSEALKAEVDKTNAARSNYPKSALAGEIVGGLAGGAGLVKSGATLAGRVGPGFLPRTLGYGAEGAAYGAAHGAGHTYTGNPSDYAQNALSGAQTGGAVGLGLGAAAPVVGKTAQAAYKGASAFFGPRVDGTYLGFGLGRGASSLLKGAAMADAPGLRTISQMGDAAMLPDAGPAMLGLAQGAATGTGPGRSALVNNLRTRDQQTAQRLAQASDRYLGPAPIPSQVEAGLKSKRSALSPDYEDALNNGSAVDTQTIIDKIDAMIPNVRGAARTELQKVRDDLFITDASGNTKVPDPHPRALLETRKAIDGNATQDANARRVLGDVRKLVDEELSLKVPGIKTIDAQYADLKRQSDALERGQSVFDTGKSAIRPSELAAEMRSAGQMINGVQGPSGAPNMIRAGARADIDRRVGTSSNDLNALEKTFGTPEDWNYDKLATLFGDQNRDAITNIITANRKFRDTYQKTVDGSQSAQRLEAANAMKGSEGGNVPRDITLTGAGLGGANWLAKTLTGMTSESTRDQVGRFLANANPQDVQRLAQILLQSAQATNANSSGFGRVMAAPGWIGATAPADRR